MSSTYYIIIYRILIDSNIFKSVNDVITLALKYSCGNFYVVQWTVPKHHKNFPYSSYWFHI